ncbi:MAG: cache domain-containing protein [Magnetococcus sp. YQC-3]
MYEYTSGEGEKGADERRGRWLWLGLFLLTAVAILVASHHFYQQEMLHLRQKKYDELSVIATAKVQEIVQWRQERLADAGQMAASPLFVQAIAEWLLHPEQSARRVPLQQHLRAELVDNIYADVRLLDREGNPLLAALETPDALDSATVNRVRAVFANRQAVISDFYRPDDGLVQLDIIAPVWDAEGRPLAALLFSTHADQYLYPLISQWPTPSPSAETLLVMADGDGALVLNELRHQSGTALSMRHSLTKTQLPAVQAVLGNRGIFMGVDYRGVATLSDLRAIPGSPWLMVSKVDMEEVLVDLHRLAGGGGGAAGRAGHSQYGGGDGLYLSSPGVDHCPFPFAGAGSPSATDSDPCSGRHHHH